MTLGVPTSPGVPAAAAADTLLARYNDLASVERVFDAHPRRDCRACSSSRSPATWALVPPRDGFLQGLRELCDRERRAAGVRRGDLGFRASPGGAQQLFGVQAGPDLPRQDHRRRPARRRVRRPRRRDGARRARGTGLPGGHAVGQSARDDRRPVVPRASCRRGCTGISRSSAPGWRRALRTPRATPACRSRSTPSDRC